MEILTEKPLLAGRRGHNTRVQLITEGPSLTKQSPKKDTEIRTILKRYAKTGVLGDPTRQPIWGDFTDPEKFENDMMLVANIRSQFATLPSKVRGRFQNDPVELLTFLQDKKNDKEAVELGLKPPTVLPTPPEKPGDTPNAPAKPDEK